MNKGELLHELHDVRGAWTQLLDGVPADARTATDIEWSLREALAELAWWERTVATVLVERASPEAPEFWRLPEAEQRARVLKASEGLSLEALVELFAAAHADLVRAIEAVELADWDGADWLRSLRGQWPPSRVVEVHVLERYRYHLEYLARLHRLLVQ